MDLEPIKKVLHVWAESNDYIKTVYIYGSRARDDFREDSDLDVAVEIIPKKNDGNAEAVFTCDKLEWLEHLQPKIPFEIHLKGFFGDASPDVKSGIEESSILVYERNT